MMAEERFNGWLAVLVVMVLMMTGRAAAQQANPYFTGDGGKGIRLAVLEPAGKGLSEDDKWMLSLVQGSIYTDFSKYSGMTIIDKQNIEKVFEEWEQSMSGNYSDADRVKIGNLTNASHILSGTVIKTPNAFMLELSVTDIQSGERKASYSHPTSTAAIENHSAIKEASTELLKQLGVNLTSVALGELKQATNIARIQADEALARGIVAKRQGTEVAALSYFFQAAILDPSLAEAVNRSSVMAANVSSGNIGEDARNDVAWRKSWVKRLEEAEQYIDRLNKTVSMPYTLFYSDEIIRGDINYQKETMQITIKTNLYGNGSIRIWAQSVEKALGAVYDGLEATERKNVWGLRWPYNSVTDLRAFNSQKKKFTIVVELVNSQNKVIGEQEFEVSGKWGYNTNYDRRPEVWVNSDTREDVTFRDVNVNDITDNLTIRIATINGEAAITAAKKGILQIKAKSKSEFDANDLYTFKFGKMEKYTWEKKEDLNLVIPNTIWDDPVISIGDDVFSRYYSHRNGMLIGLIIPNSVTSIGKSAFSYNKLKSVTIPNGVTYIGNSAFYAGELTNVIIPNSVTSIGEQAFLENKLTSITIGADVSIGGRAFGNKFEEAYQNNDHKAGTYTYYGGSSKWSYSLSMAMSSTVQGVKGQEIEYRKQEKEVVNTKEDVLQRIEDIERQKREESLKRLQQVNNTQTSESNYTPERKNVTTTDNITVNRNNEHNLGNRILWSMVLLGAITVIWLMFAPPATESAN